MPRMTLRNKPKKKILFALLVVAASWIGFAAPLAAQSAAVASLTVRITGLSSAKGQVKIALFNSSESWLGDHPAASSTVPVESLTVTWKFSDIPQGDYGIALFHDENKNGKMDKNFLGIPQEAYGFSNNQRVVLGPPKWDKSKFAVKGSSSEISIEVK